MLKNVRYIALLLLLVLASCSSGAVQVATIGPIILLPTPTVPSAAQRTSTAGTTSTSAPSVASSAPGVATDTTTAPSAAASPSADASIVANGDITTPAPSGAPKGTITFAFDSFPSYFPGLVMQTKGLLAQRGYELKLVPFDLNNQNDVSEEDRYARLQSGEYDVLATTLDGFARRANPAIGAITAVIDESAGADKLVASPTITTLNALAGKRIAFSQGSVGEYFAYYALSLAGLTPKDVTLVPNPSVDAAVAAYTGNQADAVAAWVPNVLQAEQAGAQTLIASDKLRAILDVLISGRPALTNKSDALQAFHDAWFEALKQMTDNQGAAEQAIIDWGNIDWTGIAAKGDLAASLQTIAQANLGANQLAFRSSDLLVSRVREAQRIWTSAGQAPPEADLTQVVDGRFVGVTGQNAALFSTQPPVNASFLLTAQVDLPQLSQTEQQQAQAIVKLPLEKIDFQPDSVRLTQQAAQDLTEKILPVLRSSRLYLRIDGSSAWPGPEGRFTADEIRTFARDRATSVATFLSQQGINPNRLIIGTLDPKFPQSVNDAELVQDRIVRFTLVTPQGR